MVLPGLDAVVQHGNLHIIKSLVGDDEEDVKGAGKRKVPPDGAVVEQQVEADQGAHLPVHKRQGVHPFRAVGIGVLGADLHGLLKVLLLVKPLQGLLLVVPHLDQPLGDLLLRGRDLRNRVALAVEMDLARELTLQQAGPVKNKISK